MASKLGSTVLASNLESLKDKSSELARSLEEINTAASAAGSSLSDMTKGAMGDIQNLTSQITRLNAALKRTSTTSSAIGAASVSTALGQLTGQGRGGGGGGGGGAGGGRFAPNLGGPSGPMGSLLDAAGKIPLLGRAIKGVGSVGKYMLGMTMSGMQQSRNARLGFEQSRYYSPISGLSKTGNAGMKIVGTNSDGSPMYGPTGYDAGGITQFSKFAAMGMDANRGAEITEGLLGAMGGRGGGVKDALGITQYGVKFGMAPEQQMGLAGALTLGGGSVKDLFGQSRSIGRQALITSRSRGMDGGTATQQAAERFRNARLMTQQTADYYAQQAQFGQLGNFTKATTPGMLGVIGRGTGQPGIAGDILNALRGSTLNPGGGEAGEVHMLQASGFGNPYLNAERKMASKLGMDPSSLQRRDFLEAKLFREKNPNKAILNSMIGVATKMQGAGSLAQGEYLSQITGGKVSLGQSQQLMKDLMSGNFRPEQILEMIDTTRISAGTDKDLASDKGMAGSRLMQQQAKLQNVLIASSEATIKASAALNKLQVALQKLSQVNAGRAVQAVESLYQAMAKLGGGDTEGSVKDMKAGIENLKKLLISLKEIPALTTP